MTWRALLLATVLACGRPAPSEEPPPVAQPVAEVVPEEPAPPCIVGSWEANDFVAAVRESLRADLGGATLTRASGTIRVALSPLRPSGEGDLVATADELVHRAVAGKAGFRATGTHTLTGGSTMPYRLPMDHQLLILPPREGELTAKVSVGVRIGKIRRGRTREHTAPVNFTGLYAYHCNDDRLVVQRLGANDERGDPIVLDRLVEATPEE